jgi:hypothetical protein
MSRALSESLGWLRRQVISYLAILALLLAGSWLFTEYHRAKALSAERQAADATVQQNEAAAARAQASVVLADRALAAKFAAVGRAHEMAQQEQLARERERDAHRAQHWPWPGLYGPAALAQSRLLDEQVAALQRATRAAQDSLEAAEALRDSAAALLRLEQEARGKRAEAERLRGQWRRLSALHPIEQRFPWASVWADLDRLKNEVERLQQEAVGAEKRHGEIAAAAARSREVYDGVRARAALERAQAGLQEARSRHSGLTQALDQNRYQRLQRQWRGFLSNKTGFALVALLILLGAILSRLAVKLLLYYVVAPFASRRPPVRLLGAYESLAFARPVPPARAGRISDESLSIRLGEADELLVRPEYLQSSSENSVKRTVWLLNAALPFTSVLSGMYLLTRVRSSAGDEVVLSPAHDAFDELCMIELPTGAAFVCQPRSLAAVVQPRGQGLHVTRHWRMGTVHAWLTFQLRFLVFDGPCKLILKGRRGVRMEAAGGGRLINQAATLGFDASVPYSTVRTETFVPYWLGKDELFNDRFGGIDGSYVYEERPLDRRGNVLLGRGLEGLSEGVLKVFGI